MNDGTALIPISNMNISTISDDDLETAFLSVLEEHKDAVASIRQSMTDADSAYQKYLDEGYKPSEEIAKADRAALNKAEKNIAEKYASLKAAYEKPLESTEANIKAIRAEIKKASGVVDTAVKNYENRQKDKKRGEIQAYFETKKFDLVPLERIFEDRWLNKGAKMKDISEAVDKAVDDIHANIKILEAVADYGAIAKASYLETLDMAAALRQAETLKANTEKLEREKAEREQVEQKEPQPAAKENQARGLAEKAMEFLGAEKPETPPVPDDDDILRYTLELWAKRKKMEGLKAYIIANEINYKKV